MRVRQLLAKSNYLFSHIVLLGFKRPRRPFKVLISSLFELLIKILNYSNMSARCKIS
nr:MAG TPA: hypothetical protein [Caudoviricetes sp.]